MIPKMIPIPTAIAKLSRMEVNEISVAIWA
jgi:hypothetical protein